MEVKPDAEFLRLIEGLTERQVSFCYEYLKDFSVGAALRRAGYSENTASKSTAFIVTDQMREVMAHIKRERLKRLRIDTDEVLLRIIEMMELDPADIIDENGRVLPIKKWPMSWRRSANEVMIKGDKIVRIKMPDKIKLLEMLGKHISVQAWNEKTTTEVVLSGIDQLHAQRIANSSKGVIEGSVIDG